MRLIALSMAALVLLAAPASAQSEHRDHSGHGSHNGFHNHGHAEHHDWYQRLKQPGTGYSCCNGEIKNAAGVVIEGDCRPTRAYQDDEGVWQALIDGRWTPVPPRVVLQTLAPDGNSHICANKSGMIFCFIGGSPKT